MDASQFDVLVRSVQTTTSRRSTLGGLFGVGSALVLRFQTENAGAKKKRKKKKCKDGKKKCDKKCIAKTQCCVDADCPTGGDCVGNSCVCPIGTVNCGDVCADLATDGANCGACGNACASNACVHGACTCESEGDCPEICGCAVRVEGGSACATLPGEAAECGDDNDCPLGSFCTVIGPAQICTGVCQG